MAEVITPAARSSRADARRNRELILGTADEYFAEHGVGGSLDAIAKRAGVGPGTLYRHFPTRDALLAALLSDRDDELVARRERLRVESADTAAALDGWLRAVVDWAAAFEGLPEPLRAATTTSASPLATTCEGFVTTTAEFLTAAQRDGLARSDVRARDLFLAALATSWVGGAALADDATTTALSSLVRAGWATSAPLASRAD
ncbi:TetR family transcriptional regulator [Frigoribacterium sp. Leaf263]|uniref:TetR/AcrR family transcriptional regulator n=1 Tax=Frigoribacterium sp. Leaf263 TaxID=1736313 RepID=UPI0006FDD235|nr:TetR/AcrR family transcriptional regulator [Frigoribacterium sp. Leaf263]KQO81694.1 TetR family transcriptional regulator [Frigoribacterium sp. Leaf263]